MIINPLPWIQSTAESIDSPDDRTLGRVHRADGVNSMPMPAVIRTYLTANNINSTPVILEYRPLVDSWLLTSVNDNSEYHSQIVDLVINKRSPSSNYSTIVSYQTITEYVLNVHVCRTTTAPANHVVGGVSTDTYQSIIIQPITNCYLSARLLTSTLRSDEWRQVFHEQENHSSRNNTGR